MTGLLPAPTRVRVGPTGVLLAGVLVVLGLLSGLPYLLGPVVAVAGVAAATGLRARLSRTGLGLELLPPLAALATIAFASPEGPATELFAGLGALALLLWTADDPASSPGGGRRAAPTLGFAAVLFGLAWGIALVVPVGGADVGLAGALVAVVLVLVAIVLVRTAAERGAETA